MRRVCGAGCCIAVPMDCQSNAADFGDMGFPLFRSDGNVEYKLLTAVSFFFHNFFPSSLFSQWPPPSGSISYSPSLALLNSPLRYHPNLPFLSPQALHSPWQTIASRIRTFRSKSSTSQIPLVAILVLMSLPARSRLVVVLSLGTTFAIAQPKGRTPNAKPCFSTPCEVSYIFFFFVYRPMN